MSHSALPVALAFRFFCSVVCCWVVRLISCACNVLCCQAALRIIRCTVIHGWIDTHVVKYISERQPPQPQPQPQLQQLQQQLRQQQQQVWVDVPAAVHRQGLDVPVILQRQLHADSRRCLRFSSCCIMMAVMGFFWRILRHFFALLRLSGVERQFSQLGGFDDEEVFVIEGWGVVLTPGVILPGVRPPVVH